MHFVVADYSVQCETKSHGVQATTVEKANAGTLEWCLGSSILYPCTWSSRLCSSIREFTPAGLPRHPRCDITYTTFHCILSKSLLWLIIFSPCIFSYTTLHCHTTVQFLYTVMCKQYCKTCTCTDNNKGPIRGISWCTTKHHVVGIWPWKIRNFHQY